MARASNRQWWDVLELCDIAGSELKRVGFQFHTCSMKTEACYYRWPGYNSLLRVGAHKNRDSGTTGLDHVAARITFTGRQKGGEGPMLISDDKITTLVAEGIGRYFLKAQRDTAPQDSGGQ